MTELWDGKGVTSDTLKAEVIRLAETQPDKTSVCYYTLSDYDVENNCYTYRPGCVVGTAVYNLTGKLVPNHYENSGINAGFWREALGEPGIGYNVPAHEGNASSDFLFVLRLQGRQDNGDTWGEALEYAKMHETH